MKAGYDIAEPFRRAAHARRQLQLQRTGDGNPNEAFAGNLMAMLLPVTCWAS